MTETYVEPADKTDAGTVMPTPTITWVVRVGCSNCRASLAIQINEADTDDATVLAMAAMPINETQTEARPEGEGWVAADCCSRCQ